MCSVTTLAAIVLLALACCQAASGQVLSADSRPEYTSSCSSSPVSCNPFSSCRTWVTSSSLIGTYPGGTAATLGTPTITTTGLTTGYGYNYYQPWPSSTNQQVSGLTFSGHKAQNITFNAWFPVAMLTHVNFPISAPPTQVCNLLSLTIPFYLTYKSASGVTSTTSTTLPVSFTVEETPNTPCSTLYGQANTSTQSYPANWQGLNGKSQCPYGPTCTQCYGKSCSCSYTCDCKDRVTISGGYTNNQVLSLGGKSFFMAVLGFTTSSSFSSSDTPVSSFTTVESASTTGYLYARLVQTCSSNSDCDDGVSCTTDTCLSASSSLNTGGYSQNFCYYTYDDSLCTNGCVSGTCTATGCNISSTTSCSGYIAPVINCMTCSTTTATCLVSLGYTVSGTPVADSTGVVSIEPTTSNNFFVVNGKTVVDLGQPRNFYVSGASSTVYSAGYVTIAMSDSAASISWTLSGLTVRLDQTTQCAGWGSCVTPSTPTPASLFSSLSTYLAVDTSASTYTFWYNFTVASTPTCTASGTTSSLKLQSLVVKVPTCSSGLTILSTTDGCYSNRISSGGAYLTASDLATVDPTIAGATCLFDANDGNMGFNGYDGFDIPLNDVGAGKTCLIGLQVNYKTCPNVGWSATNSVTSSGRVSVVTNRACSESCGLCNTLPIFGPISTTCAGAQPSCTASYQYLDATTCTCQSCKNTACSQSYQMDSTCTCVACPAPSCASGYQPSSNYCDNTCVACSSPCSCSSSVSSCYQRVNYTNSQCGICYTCPSKANYSLVAGSSTCSYTACSLTCDTDYYSYPSDLCGSCQLCNATAVAATCGPNRTNSNHPCYCSDCTQGSCASGFTHANPAATCNTTCIACPTCPGNSSYTDATKQCTYGGTCQQCPLTACAPDYAPDPTNLCSCIACPACKNGTRTNSTWSCDCTPCDKGCSAATGSVNGIDCTNGCNYADDLCADCLPCSKPSCPANQTYGTNYCLGCVPCSVTCPAGKINNPSNTCACVTCSADSSSLGYVACPANSTLDTSTCTCQACTAPTCKAPTQANYADSCNTGCQSCSLSKNCPVNQTWDNVTYCNPCIDCPANTVDCAVGFVYIAPTVVNDCPVCANCSEYYTNISCPLNQTRSSDPCTPGCFDCPEKTRHADYQVNYTDLCQPLYYCDPAVTNAACPANHTVDPTDSCLCIACVQAVCTTNYRPTDNACAACVECPAIDCPVNQTQGDDTCNACSECTIPDCPASSHPNWDDICSGCVQCNKADTVCAANFTVNLSDTCSCAACSDPACSGNYRYTSSNLCDGCTYCNLPVCNTNFTREGLTSNCQPCVACTPPTCSAGTILTVQEGACPYCAPCVSGENVPACAFGFRVDSDDSCLCEQCTAPSCGANHTSQNNTCLPCVECPLPTCTANYTVLDTCDGCIPCTTVCAAGSVYTNPLDICQGCTDCATPECGYGLEVADDLCTCTACDTPSCPTGFQIDATTGCGCASCSGTSCPLGTVLSTATCTCEVLTIYNEENVTTTRCNSTDRDACGVCYGNNNTCIGCDGQVGSGRYVDACGVVCGTGTTCSGCTGDSCAICTEKVDLCGVCGGNSSTCDGCDGVPASGSVYDICGVCAGNGTSCLGCYGVPFGPACSNAITPGEAAAVSVLAALASIAALVLALIIWRMRQRPEILFQEWDNLIAEHLTEIQANPIFHSAETEINPIFGQ